MMELKRNMVLSYEERQAIPVIRKLIMREPTFVLELFKGISKESAVNVLLQAQRELKDLHLLSQAIVQAASIIVKMDEANNVSQEGEKV